MIEKQLLLYLIFNFPFLQQLEANYEVLFPEYLFDFAGLDFFELEFDIILCIPFWYPFCFSDYIKLYGFIIDKFDLRHINQIRLK